MNLNIVGRHLHVTPAVRKYVVSKLNKVSKYFKNMVSATVRLTPDYTENKKIFPKAEVVLHVVSPDTHTGKDIVVQTTNDNLYKAINGVFYSLTRQVLKYKTARLIARRKKHPSVTGTDL